MGWCTWSHGISPKSGLPDARHRTSSNGHSYEVGEPSAWAPDVSSLCLGNACVGTQHDIVRGRYFVSLDDTREHCNIPVDIPVDTDCTHANHIQSDWTASEPLPPTPLSTVLQDSTPRHAPVGYKVGGDRSLTQGATSGRIRTHAILLAKRILVLGKLDSQSRDHRSSV